MFLVIAVAASFTYCFFPPNGILERSFIDFFKSMIFNANRSGNEHGIIKIFSNENYVLKWLQLVFISGISGFRILYFPNFKVLILVLELSDKIRLEFRELKMRMMVTSSQVWISRLSAYGFRVMVYKLIEIQLGMIYL